MGRWFLPGVIAFLGLHLVIRLMISPTLESDDADLAVFTQSLEWGYSEQPPLYSWIIAVMVPIFGLNLFTLTLVKTLLLIAVMVLMRSLARRVLPPDSEAIADRATLAIVLIPTFAWHALIFLTHSILAVLATLILLRWVLVVIDHRRMRDYVILGIIVGLGALTKYTYLHVVIALFLAALSDPISRRAVLNWRMLIAGLVAAGIVFPHAIWLREHWPTVWMTLSGKAVTGDGWRLLSVLRGLLHFAVNGGLSVLPLLIAFAFALGTMRFIWRVPTDASRLIGRFLGMGVLIFVVQIIALGADRLHERWFQPFIVIVPLLLLSRIDFASWTPRAKHRWTFAIVAFASGYTLVRLGQIIIGDTLPGSPPKRFPITADYQPIANELRSRLPAGSIIITSERQIAGNLRILLPEMILGCRSHLDYMPPLPSGWESRPIIAIWHIDDGEMLPATLRILAGRKLGIELTEQGTRFGLASGEMRLWAMELGR